MGPAIGTTRRSRNIEAFFGAKEVDNHVNSDPGVARKETVEQNFMNFDAKGLRQLVFGLAAEIHQLPHPVYACIAKQLVFALRNAEQLLLMGFNGRMVMSGEGREA